MNKTRLIALIIACGGLCSTGNAQKPSEGQTLIPVVFSLVAIILMPTYGLLISMAHN